MSSIPALEIIDVTKRFGPHQALRSVNLDVAEGEFMVLVGPSGCGKTTLLRMVAGLEQVSDGIIAIRGKPVNHEPPQRRNLAMVFQNYALYPHLTVQDNLEFGLRLARLHRAERKRRVAEAATMLQLTGYLGRKPRQLSGG